MTWLPSPKYWMRSRIWNGPISSCRNPISASEELSQPCYTQKDYSIINTQFKKMRIIKIGMSLISLLVLASCNNEQEITPYRGKVKYETISVSSKLAGRINKLYVTEGDEVQKGDTLAFLDIPEINAKMIQADGAMKAARGQLNMAHVGATEEQLIQIDGQLDAAKAELQFARESYSR